MPWLKRSKKQPLYASLVILERRNVIFAFRLANLMKKINSATILLLPSSYITLVCLFRVNLIEILLASLFPGQSHALFLVSSNEN